MTKAYGEISVETITPSSALKLCTDDLVRSAFQVAGLTPVSKDMIFTFANHVMAIGKIRGRSFQTLGQKEAFKLGYCRIAVGIKYQDVLQEGTSAYNLAAKVYGSTGVTPAALGNVSPEAPSDNSSKRRVQLAYQALEEARKNLAIEAGKLGVHWGCQ